MAISNASNQIVKVNLIPGIIPSVLHLSQYDTGAGRPITFSVYDGSQAFTIPSGVSIVFEGTKPDGNGFSFTCSKSGNNALLTNYTNQMTALSGKIMCQLVFTNTSGGRVGSLPVLMVVTPAGINGDTVISDSDIEAIIAAQNQYALLNARIDQIIAPSGEAPNPAEITDARIGVDNVTYPNLGTAIRTQVGDLKSVIGELEYEWVNGKYVYYNNGQEGTSVAYDCTDYIPCVSIGLSVKTENGNDSAGICFYDINKKFISGFNARSQSYNFFNLTIPENAAYVRISCLDRYKNNFAIKEYDAIPITQNNIESMKKDIAALEQDNNLIMGISQKSRNLLPVSSKTSSVMGTTMVYGDGKLAVSGTSTGAGGRTVPLTDIMTLPAGQYMLWVKNGIANFNIFLEKFSDNSVIAEIANGNAWTTAFTLAAQTDVYIGANVSSGIAYSHTFQIMLESGSEKTEYQEPSWLSVTDAEARKALILMNTFWSYAMGKILCIGDSLTSGACFTGNWDGASIDQNYPRLLGRMLDADVTNAGVSGLTASQWYANEISKYILANYDTFIIWLGTNGGLTDTLDTDVNPYQDYNNFADTNTGNYCKIIERIKANNSDCLIILTKVFVSDTTNTVIDKIATKYSLPVVDNSDLTVANYPALHGNINNVHFTKTGNLFIADRYVQKMAEVFADNPAKTNYGLTARTN